MKKFLCLFLSSLLIFSLFAFPVSAASATFSLTGSGSVTVGGTVTVKVNLSGSEKIGSWRFSLTYDPSVLEYVSGADSGGGGAVLFSDSSDGVSTYNRSVVFRARKIGSATVSVSDAQVVSFDSASNMGVTRASKTIEVTAAPTMSNENNLSALTLSSGSLSPAFDPKVTSYTVTVPFEITSLVFSATPKDSKATVSVSGADALKVGENQVSVTVTAQNGTKKTYTITVTREESELSGATVTIEGNTYIIAYDPASLQVPAGYEPGTANFKDKKILVYSTPEKTVQICFLYTETVEDGAWFIFNEEKDLFTPYVSLDGASTTFVVLTLGEKVKVPEGYQKETIQIGQQSVTAYAGKDSKKNGIYLVYGFAEGGEPGFYYYDVNLGTFASYFAPSSAQSKETVKEMDSLKKNLKSAEDKVELFLIITLSVGIIAVLLLLGLILSLVTRKPKEKPVVPVAPTKAEIPSVMEEEPPVLMADPDPAPEIAEPTPVKKRTARRTIEKVVPAEEKNLPEENEIPWLSFEEKEEKIFEKEENHSENQ